jgi:hypothetical protein
MQPDEGRRNGQELQYINSNNRINGSHSDFTIKIQLKPGTTYKYVTVLDASIPKSFYIVPEHYNTFTLDENGASTTITIPAGNYTRKSLKETLATQLTSSSPNSWTYAVTYSNINSSVDTGKYTVSVSGNGGVQPSFIFTTNMYEILGFDRNSTHSFLADTLVAPNVANLSRESTIFIRSDVCQEQDDILQNIVTSDNPSFSYVDFRNYMPNEYKKKYNSGADNVFYFRITDENDRGLDLNGLNLQLTLLFM